MPSQIRHIAVDCGDAYALAGFWSAVTGWPVAPDDNAGDEQVAVLPPDGSGLVHPGAPKGRPQRTGCTSISRRTIATRAAEVDRLVGLGATHIRDHVGPRRLGWTVLADPEGNEFCVESSRDEVAAVRSAGS